MRVVLCLLLTSKLAKRHKIILASTTIYSITTELFCFHFTPFTSASKPYPPPRVPNAGIEELGKFLHLFLRKKMNGWLWFLPTRIKRSTPPPLQARACSTALASYVPKTPPPCFYGACGRAIKEKKERKRSAVSKAGIEPAISCV